MGKKTILVAEDNVSNMKLVYDILEMQGYNILQAFDGEQAIKVSRQNCDLIDLILMDIQLPKISGFDAVKMLKDDELTKKIPIFAVSAHAMEQDVQKALEIGCVEYITKPINLADFINRVNDYLN